MREYFRGNLWTNTPDILPPVLQDGGRPAFMMRVVLAATMSSVYGSTADTSSARVKPCLVAKNILIPKSIS